jgi:hypothetical protein
MKMGGVFISNHILCNDDEHDHSIPAMIELMARSMGYPTHQLPGEILKKGVHGHLCLHNQRTNPGSPGGKSIESTFTPNKHLPVNRFTYGGIITQVFRGKIFASDCLWLHLFFFDAE